MLRKLASTVHPMSVVWTLSLISGGFCCYNFSSISTTDFGSSAGLNGQHSSHAKLNIFWRCCQSAAFLLFAARFPFARALGFNAFKLLACAFLLHAIGGCVKFSAGSGLHFPTEGVETKARDISQLPGAYWTHISEPYSNETCRNIVRSDKRSTNFQPSTVSANRAHFNSHWSFFHTLWFLTCSWGPRDSVLSARFAKEAPLPGAVCKKQLCARLLGHTGPFIGDLSFLESRSKTKNKKITKSQILAIVPRSRWSCTDPKSGLRPEMGKKRPKNGFWPHRKKGDRWPKIGKLAQKWVKNGYFPIFWPFPPPSSSGAKSFFWPFFPISGRRPDLRSVQGNRDRNNSSFFFFHLLVKTLCFMSVAKYHWQCTYC